MVAGTKVKDQYGVVSIVISVWDTCVVTTKGRYHISKIFAV